MSQPLISIVVCTYNRSDLLKETLTDLCQQTLEKDYYDIWVVDNNSKDDTRYVVQEICRKNSHVNYVFESRQGLSNARNRGMEASGAPYIGYIDDDCQIPDHFLSEVKNIIDSISPDVFGGPSYSFYNSQKPKWYKDKYGSNAPFQESRMLNKKECGFIIGCNMFFKRSLLSKIGGFDPELGMCGNKVFYGEETAVIRAAMDEFPETKTYYDPKIYLYHLVQNERMRLQWFFRVSFAFGGTSFRMSQEMDSRVAIPQKNKFKSIQQLLLTIAVIFRDSLRVFNGRDQDQYPCWQNYIIEHTFQHITKLGYFWEQLKYSNEST